MLTRAPAATVAISDSPADRIDAKLLDLLAKFRTVSGRLERAAESLRLAEGRYVEPQLPGELLRRRGDDRLPLPIRYLIGEAFSEAEIDDARRYLKQNRAKRQLWQGEFGASLRTRLVEIDSASRAHERAQLAARRLAGIPRAVARWRRLLEERANIYATAGRTSAATGAGVLAKLQIAACDVSAQILDFADDTSAEFVLAGAVLDAVTLAGDARDRGAADAIRSGLAATP